MKKNGYVRRFLALFLTLVMIMADSSVTTFAATVGMVRQQKGENQQAAVQANGKQYNIQVNISSELDLANLEYKYITLGTKEQYQAVNAKSNVVPLQAGSVSLTTSEIGNFNLYLVKGIYQYEMQDVKQNGDKIRQGDKKFKISVTADKDNTNNLTVNIEKIQAQLQPGPSADYKSILGSSLHFGIVANEFTCKGDLEANLAVGTLHGSGSMKSSKNNGGNGTTLIGAYTESGWYIFKNPEGGKGDLILYTTPEAAKKFSSDIKDKGVTIDTETYSRQEIQQIVSNMVNEAQNTSDELVTNGQRYGIQYSDAEENGVLDLTGLSDGTYYINFENGEYANTHLKFKITENQNIVLNIPDDTVKLKQYQIWINGQEVNISGYANGGIGEKACENIIFNLNQASSVTSDQIHGIVLVPRGSFENKAVGAGWIIANSVTSGGAEWHNLSKDIPTVTSYALKAKKTVNGKAPVGNETGKFTFKLYKLDDKGNATPVDAKTNGDGGLVLFDTFGNITETGTYWYKITEEGDIAGYTRDTTEYYAEVKVTAVSNNGVIISKNANVTYHKGSKDGATVTIPTFNNTKKENETSASINVRKTFTNGSADKAFSFKLTPDGNAPMPKGTENGVKSINASQNDDIKSFGNIKYTEAGTYTYKVTEDSSNAETGITYDNSTWTVTVTVPEGLGTPTVTYSKGKDTSNTAAAEFTNSKYKASGITELKAEKQLVGREFREGDKWTFTVTCDTQGAPMPEHPVITTGATSGNSETLDFGKINYTLDNVGTYVYTITESGSVANVENDPVTARTVTVTVTDNGDGTLSVQQTKGANGLTFTNKYAEGETTLGVTKVLSGREFKAGDAWTFTLEGGTADTPMPAQKSVTTTATSGNSQTLEFGTIKYKLKDVGKTYTYTITESGSGEGVTNDPNASRTVTVTVAEGSDGKLAVTKTEPAGGVTFTNTYSAAGEIELKAEKQLVGREFREGDKWTFTVTCDTQGAPMPEHPVITTGATSGNSETLDFGKINYTLDNVGTYVYTITESGSVANVENDSIAARTVTVTVTDNGDGTLNVQKTEDKNGLTFTNKYAEGETTLGVTKVLSGREFKAGDAWTFTLEGGTADTPMPAQKSVTTTATSGNSQTLEFGTIKYKLKDVGKTYTYTITESGSGEGVTNDPNASRTVTVTVAEGSDGKLAVTKTEPTGGVTFTNTYSAAGETELKAEKQLVGREFREGDKWTFTVTCDTQGAPMPEHPVITTSATSGNSETLDFGKINYTLDKVGTYVYTITESGNVTNVENDPIAARTVTVTVTDNGDGTLNVQKTEDKNGLTFTNKYAEGETTLGVTKVLSGREFKAGDAWTFTLEGGTANTPMPAQTSVTTTATSGYSQALEFGKIKYSLADVGKTYTYTITESGSGEGVTNDSNATRTITVNVAEGSDGKLAITKTESEGGTVFTNTYSAAGSLTLEANKTLKNKTLEADTFSFELKDESENVLQKVPNEAGGAVKFAAINYTLADVGTHTYTVSEVKGKDGTVTYDENVYTVEATVTDAGNGTLNVSRVIKKNGEKVDSIDFTNTYIGEIEIAGTKTWNDNSDQDGIRPTSITVNLLANGEKVRDQKVTPDGNGKWNYKFEKLPEYNENGKITYTVTETQVEGYTTTYDDYNIVNSYTPGETSATITKLWSDADNQDGIRPASITVTLLANGKETDTTVTLKPDNNWTETVTGLPEKENGEFITYTWKEPEVDGYKLTKTDKNGTVTTLTNTHISETTEINGTKTWDDADNQDGIRPESITINLLANGTQIQSKTVSPDGRGIWSYSFTDLPKYENGDEIVYTVTEDAVADYTTEISGYDITNSYAPGKTSVTVTKAWVDNNNRDGHRPDEIKVQLKADGENSGEEITLNAENNWTYTWPDLDQKKAGKDIAYTVEETGKAAGYISAVTGNATEGFIITNTITSVKISKVDITDQKELAGAHIQVIDKDGNVVEEWDSTWEAHEVTGLKPGETYTLRETIAPDGYTVTGDTTFTLKEDGTVDKDNTSTTMTDDGTLLVEDSRTSVKVSKVDISDGEELEGAHIQIIDQDGNIVDEWDSTKEAHVTEKLKTGKTYTLRETVAPDGYLLTNDTTFVLKEDGTVDTEKTTTVSENGVLLVQDSLANSASIAVTKRLTYIGDNLVARDQTFYVALYSDEECTKRVSDVKALEFKNADSSTVVFSDNIKAGKTYYIGECTEDGTAQVIGSLADGTTYEAVFGDGNSTTVTDENGITTVSFENVFSSFPPDGFYKEGKLTITKRVLGADGDTKNSDEVFYAGIFDDPEHTQLSSQVEQNIIQLSMDGGYEVSETISVGLAQTGATVTLYVTETDSNGKPVAGSEDFGYKVTVSADSVTIDENNLNAEVVITNQEETTVTPTVTPTPSTDEEEGGGYSEDHSGGYGSKSPKTGDDTPIGTYLMLLLAAGALIAAETERRRRRNRK